MTEHESQSALLPDFIDGFINAHQEKGIPNRFLLWTAILAIASTAGRNVWNINKRGKYYPNLYALLIGAPGTSKTQSERLLRPLLRGVGIPLVADHFSHASLLDEMTNGIVSPSLCGHPEIEDYHHAVIVSSEFGQTFPKYDEELFKMLQSWWDCGDEVTEIKRGKNEGVKVRTANPCCNILAGIQPALMSAKIPDHAWSDGFMARSIMIYEPMIMEIPVLLTEEEMEDYGESDTSLREQTLLLATLERIKNLGGKMKQTKEYYDTYNAWFKMRKKDKVPIHPKLEGYNGRREFIILKLSMISALSRRSMELEKCDFDRAREWLMVAEGNMDSVFLELSTQGSRSNLEAFHSHVGQLAKWDVTVPIPRNVVYKYLTGLMDAERVEKFIEIARNGGFVKMEVGAAAKHYFYCTPNPKVQG